MTTETNLFQLTPIPSSKALKAFKLGNDDELDWQLIYAASEADAQAIYLKYHPHGYEASECHRVEKLDAKAQKNEPYVVDWHTPEGRALSREAGLYFDDDFWCESCEYVEPNQDDCETCGTCAECGCLHTVEGENAV